MDASGHVEWWKQFLAEYNPPALETSVKGRLHHWVQAVVFKTPRNFGVSENKFLQGDSCFKNFSSFFFFIWFVPTTSLRSQGKKPTSSSFEEAARLAPNSNNLQLIGRG